MNKKFIDKLNLSTLRKDINNKIDEAIESLGKVLNFKGSVEDVAHLPTTGNKVGDVYYVEDVGAEYVWVEEDGTETWEELGPIIDLSIFYTKTEADDKFVDVTGDTMTGDLNIANGNENKISLKKSGSIAVDGGTASGTGSIASGVGATASGNQSVAIGSGAQASGNQSVALGSGAQASGYGAIAIGGGAMAKGSASIAVGGGANVIGGTSVSIGANTINASNNLMVGGGNNGTDNAHNSIVGGTGNSAKNKNTLTFGDANFNAGVNSVALGRNNFVGGKNSQAEGNYSVASGDMSHAEGQGSELTTVGAATVLTSATRGTFDSDRYTDITFAQGSLDIKAGDLFNTIPCISVSLSNGTYTASFAGNLTTIFKVDDTLTIARSNHVASGTASHVEGNGTSAFAPYSHAEGLGTKTLGSNGGAHAEGNNTIADSSNGPAPHAEGYGTTASNFCAHAEGNSTIASAAMSHAEGNGTTASATPSHSEGENTKASGSSSHAEGNGTTARGYVAHAEGSSTTAYEAFTHTEGSGTVAIGTYSHTEGSGTIATGIYSHAEGYGGAVQPSIGSITITEVDTTNNTIKGTLSAGTIEVGNYIKVVVGSTPIYRTVLSKSGATPPAYTLNSVANISVNDVLDFGITNGRASGYASHSEGYGTIADGQYSHSEGYATRSSNIASHAEGYATTTGADYQHVQGKYNIQDNTSAHIVGNGTADNALSNCHTLDFNGNAWYAGDVYVGSTSGTHKDTGSKKLATEDYVDNAITTAITNAISASY